MLKQLKNNNIQTLCVMVIVVIYEINRVQILHDIVPKLYGANTLEKDMNPSILPASAIDKQ